MKYNTVSAIQRCLANVKPSSLRVNLSLLLALASILFSTSAAYADGIEGPPHFSVMDENNVNLVSGQLSLTVPDLNIGSGALKLQHSVQTYNNLFRSFQDNFTGIFSDSDLYLGSISDTFTVPASWPRTSALMSGGVFLDAGGDERIYVAKDGTRVHYSAAIQLPLGRSLPAGYRGSATKIVYPNGHEVQIHYTSRDSGGTGDLVYRIQSVTSNSGYQLKYQYISDDATSDIFDWSRPTKVAAVNNAYEYCDPLSTACSFTNTWPTVSYTWPTAYSANFTTSNSDFIVTFPNGSKATYKHALYCTSGMGSTECSPKQNNSMRIAKIIDSTSQSDATREFEYRNAFYCSGFGAMQCNTLRFGMLVKSKTDGREFTYQYSVPTEKYIPIQAESKGDGNLTVLINHMDPNSSLPYQVIDQRNGKKFDLVKGTKVSRVINSGSFLSGNYTSAEFKYDVSGNITERREIAKDGSLPDLVSTAAYENHCDSEQSRNKPSWTQDPKGKRTDYSYHCPSGQVASVTYPADDNGVRPQNRYSYSQQYAWLKTASGSYQRAATPIWLLATESYCRTGSASANGCAVAGDEVVIAYDYGAAQGPNNLLLRAKRVTADGQTLTTCYDYDMYGNLIAETAAKANVSSCY